MALYQVNAAFDWAGIHYDVGHLVEDDSYLFTKFPTKFTRFPSATPTTFTQTYLTTDATVPNATAAAVATTSATNSSPYGYAQAQADAIVTAVNALVADSLQNRKLLNAVIDALQAAGIAL